MSIGAEVSSVGVMADVFIWGNGAQFGQIRWEGGLGVDLQKDGLGEPSDVSIL